MNDNTWTDKFMGSSTDELPTYFSDVEYYIKNLLRLHNIYL